MLTERSVGFDPKARYVLALAHLYQPPREELGVATRVRANHAAEVNGQVVGQCYWRLLGEPVAKDVKPLPPGFATSFYGVLRESIKGHFPEKFAVIRENLASTPEIEYMLLGDLWHHFIAPPTKGEVMDPEYPGIGGRTDANLDMWVKIGDLAMHDDVGVISKGIWLPETAVSNQVLKVLRKNGKEFVVLQNIQLTNPSKNPSFVPIFEGEDVVDTIAVIHGSAFLSGEMAFPKPGKDITITAEAFLENSDFNWMQILAWITDGEFYNHHQPGKDEFLFEVTRPQVLARYGRKPFSIKQAIEASNKQINSGVYENSSWTCTHGLKHWTGDPECNCDGVHNEQALDFKRSLRRKLNRLGKYIDDSLDSIDPNWRQAFIVFFLETRRTMFYDGDIDADIARLSQRSETKILRDPRAIKLFLANSARWTAEASCVWYWGEENRVEHNIGTRNLEEARLVLSG